MFASRLVFYLFLQILEKIRCSSFASSQSVRACGFNSGTARTIIRRKCLVSRASFRQVPMFFSRKLSGFGNCVVGFDVVSANTSGGSNELTDDSIGYRILWNRLRKIDNCFAKSGRSFFQIVNAFCLWFFADKSCAIIPKRIVGARIPHLPISSFLRHSSFELRHSCQAASCNCVYSHALANLQSRLTVTGEILSTSAISS